MRLDKYLQVSRLIKRRTSAKEACLAGRVQINGKIAKAGSEVKEGDEITLTWGKRLIKVKVAQVPLRNVPAAQAKTLYQLLEERTIGTEE
ncbi:MAG TPA: RNA-binding S4 domain-containing protein [Syntrophaceticus sp.]|nr:RNA-binding S4 domain-containing protein [Syntrophaceticus sp.]